MNSLPMFCQSIRQRSPRFLGVACGVLFTALLSACLGTSADKIPGEYDIEGCRAWVVDQLTFVPSFRLDCQQTAGLEAAKQYDRINEIRIESSAAATDLDLSGFDDLETLAIDNHHIVTLNLTNNLKLQKLQLNSRTLTALALPAVQFEELIFVNVPALAQPDVSGIQVEYLGLQGNLGFDPDELLSLSEIWKLHIDSASVSGLDLSVLPNLKILRLSDVIFSALDVANHPNLYEISISESDFTTLDLSLSTIGSLRLDNTAIAELFLPEGRNFERLQFHRHQSHALKVHGGENFKEFRMSESLTVDLDLSSLRSLGFLALSDSQVQNLDLSNITMLENLYIDNTPIASLTLNETGYLQTFELLGTRLACTEINDLIAGLNDEANVTVDVRCAG